MMIKLIQDFGKVMETWIDKIQEKFNKDLEQLKNRHTEISNTITETENTLEGNNSRLSEAEERISELEDKMLEMTSEEKNKEWKELRLVSETSGTISNTITFKLQRSLRRRVPGCDSTGTARRS